jgi:hypothetical protein
MCGRGGTDCLQGYDHAVSSWGRALRESVFSGAVASVAVVAAAAVLGKAYRGNTVGIDRHGQPYPLGGAGRRHKVAFARTAVAGFGINYVTFAFWAAFNKNWLAFTRHRSRDL